LALVALVLTKENALFVWLGVIVILIANRWLRIGTVTRGLLVLTFLAPAISLIVLMLLAGGVPILIDTYRLFITKNYSLKYSELTQDGPWHRYLVDLLLVSPIILLLAVGGIYNLTREKRLEWFLAIFLVSTYTMMCGIRYGINLRFANMWDLPLRMLALSQLCFFAAILQRWRNVALASFVALICITEIHRLSTAVDAKRSIAAPAILSCTSCRSRIGSRYTISDRFTAKLKRQINRPSWLPNDRSSTLRTGTSGILTVAPSRFIPALHALPIPPTRVGFNIVS